MLFSLADGMILSNLAHFRGISGLFGAVICFKIAINHRGMTDGCSYYFGNIGYYDTENYMLNKTGKVKNQNCTLGYSSQQNYHSYLVFFSF